MEKRRAMEEPAEEPGLVGARAREKPPDERGGWARGTGKGVLGGEHGGDVGEAAN